MMQDGINVREKFQMEKKGLKVVKDELAERRYGKIYDELCEDRKRIIDKLIQIVN